jgi:hypothetical protein
MFYIFINEGDVMRYGKHIDSISPEALEQAHTKINEINVSFESYVAPLTPEERRGMIKMGDKRLSFVEKARDFARANPDLVPPFLDVDAFDADFNEAHELWTLAVRVLRLYENITDTEMQAGSEAYQAALMFYHSVKEAATHDVAGARAVYEQLRPRFFSSHHKSAVPETEPPAESIPNQESLS